MIRKIINEAIATHGEKEKQVLSWDLFLSKDQYQLYSDLLEWSLFFIHHPKYFKSFDILSIPEDDKWLDYYKEYLKIEEPF